VKANQQNRLSKTPGVEKTLETPCFLQEAQHRAPDTGTLKLKL